MRISDWSSDVCSSDLELRRWLLGPESRARGRRRGLAARLMDVASYDEQGAAAIEAIIRAARDLPSEGWLARLAEGDPFGPIERLLAEVRGTALARVSAQDAGYRSEEHTTELQSLMRISYAVFCLKKKKETVIKSTEPTA